VHIFILYCEPTGSEERTKTENYLCKELERVKDNMKLQLLHDAEIRTLGLTHQREKNLVQRNLELRNTVRYLKERTTASKSWEIRNENDNRGP
jgi:hypothetical protein